MTSNILSAQNAILLIVDVQEKLVAAVPKGDKVKNNTSKLASAANILGVTTIVSEQYPKGLGHTAKKVCDSYSPNTKVIEKTSFSCLKEDGFLDYIQGLEKKQIILCGIETHVCVHQTANELLKEGFEVHVVQDACASRNKFEYKTGIQRMIKDGCIPTCTETVIFELLGSAKHPKFKEVQALIK